MPQFFLHEYVYDAAAEYLAKANDGSRQQEYKAKFINLLRCYAGKVNCDSEYQGVPVLFHIEYFDFSIKLSDQKSQANLAEGASGDKDRSIVSVETGISRTDYRSAKDILKKYEEALKKKNDTNSKVESAQAIERKEDDLSLKKSLYSLCRLNDIQKILESYKDLWLVEKTNRSKKTGASRSNDKIVATFGNYKNSRA